MHQDPAEPLLDREGLQQRLTVRGADVEISRDQIGELARIMHAGEHLLHHLFRQPGLLTQLGGAGAGLLVETDKRRIIGIERLQLLRLEHDRLEVAVLVSHVHGDATALAMQQQLHAGEPALHLTDAGDGPDGEETVRAHRFDILPLGDGEDQPIRSGERGLDGAQRSWTPRADWRGGTRKEYHLTEGQDGEYETLSAFRHV